jgi:toxin ParE1/3/4
MPRTRRHRVVWTETARGDIGRLASYLFVEAPLRAEELVDEILERAESLSTSPLRGRWVPELRWVGDRTWRELQHRPWRIIYRVTPGYVVQIHAVLDGRRNLEDILLERLLHE